MTDEVPSASSDAAPSAVDLLYRVLQPDPPPFAVLQRADHPGVVEVLVGTVIEIEQLRQLTAASAGHDLLVAIPFRQIAERGFACHDGGEPMLVLQIHQRATISTRELLELLPDVEIATQAGAFDLDDDEYARIVQEIIDEEIRAGEGSNFVIRRSFRARLRRSDPQVLLTVLRRLLSAESNAYWTFVLHTPGRSLVGASPEQHVRLRHGLVRMNPISGTYRYPPDGPELNGLLSFLADQKEADELFMVLDEELKMLARICGPGLRVLGPYLREMAHLAHTEYVIEGPTTHDVATVLHQTMFAPTIIGSPLENACRVITRRERGSRGYYGGALALIGRESTGAASLDSAILIRTAELRPDGGLRIDVGATLVRDSRPEAEVAETWSKVNAVLVALGLAERSGGRSRSAASWGEVGEISEALVRRNQTLSRFWLGGLGGGGSDALRRLGGSVLVVDFEDTFTAMLAHKIRSLGMDVDLRSWQQVRPNRLVDYDCVVLGPGPGDPANRADPRIAAVDRFTRALLARRVPFLAECLSHQVLCAIHNLELFRKPRPHQGTQRVIELFGHLEPVGFYNSFAARMRPGQIRPMVQDGVRLEISADPASGEIHAVRGPGFASIQFHLETVLTCNGTEILARLLADAMSARTWPRDPRAKLPRRMSARR